jgi:hypothetical protein
MYQNQTNIISVLLIFYLLIASGCTEKLMAKQMREFINGNRMMQHIISFLTLFVLISTLGGLNDIKDALIYALIGYIWFLFSTKLDVHWNIIILILLFIGYMVENQLNQSDGETKDDPILNEEQKKEIIDEREKKKNIVIGSIFVITLIGTLVYSYKKHNQYGDGYDVMRFMFE